MSKRFAAPLLLSFFSVSCGSSSGPNLEAGHDTQARKHSATEADSLPSLPDRSTPGTSTITSKAAKLIMKCLTLSGWELELVLKDNKTLVANYTYEADGMRAKQSIELSLAKMHNDLGSAGRNAYGISSVTKVTGAKVIIIGDDKEGATTSISGDALTCADRPESFLEIKIAK
jgi:hypothetical protein